MPIGDRAQLWLRRAGWFFLAYVLLIGLTAPFWTQFPPPQSLASGIAFFTLLPLGGAMLYMTGEIVVTPWRELSLWGRALKTTVLLTLAVALVLLAVIFTAG